MNARAFKFFLGEGIKSFLKNGLMSVASVVTITLCLILCGVYILFSMNLNYAAKQVEANYEIQIFIKEDTPQSSVGEVAKQLEALDNVNTVQFLSKQQALEQWMGSMKGNLESLEGLEEDNPLRDSFKITLHDLSLAENTAAEIEGINGVAYVKNNKDVIDKLVDITAKVKNVSFYCMVFFAVISVFIISNSIRITVFARRREVNIMKFVGATDWFIRLPFMIEGIIAGIIGAVVSVMLVSGAYNYFLSTTGTLIESTVHLYQTDAVFKVLAAWLTGMGAGLGAAGSMLSLRKHLYV